MTRTARRKAKKEAHPATPWEELSGGVFESGYSEDQNHETSELRLVKKNKATHLTISERTKKSLRKQTGKSMKRKLLSDTVQLIESNMSSLAAAGAVTEVLSLEINTEQEPAEVRRDEVTECSGKKKKLKKNVSKIVSETFIPTQSEAKKRRVEPKRLQKNKKKKQIEDTLHLPSHSEDQSDSDTSPSPHHTEHEESGEDVSNGGGPNVVLRPEMEQENDSVHSEEKTVKDKNKGRSTRIKIGNRWMKAPPPVQNNSNKETEREEGEGEGDEVRRKRRRRMDEESRQKRVEQRRVRRQRKKVCFNCRQPGHQVGDCPSSSTGICFKCGSSEHSCQQCKAKVPPGEFPYAKCFICGEMGHLTRSCPDNPRGLYPRGGGCKMCGSVEHLKTNCPEAGKTTSTKSALATPTAKGGGVNISSSSADALDDTQPLLYVRTKPKTKRKGKVVVF